MTEAFFSFKGANMEWGKPLETRGLSVSVSNPVDFFKTGLSFPDDRICVVHSRYEDGLVLVFDGKGFGDENLIEEVPPGSDPLLRIGPCGELHIDHAGI